MAGQPEAFSKPRCAAIVLRDLNAVSAEGPNGSGYVSPVYEYDCERCEGIVTETEIGISAPDCPTTQSCELSMTTMRPELFDELLHDGDNRAACAHCSAEIAITRDQTTHALAATVMAGQCRIDAAGDRYRQTGRDALNNMPLHPPESPADMAHYNGSPTNPDSALCTGNQLTQTLNEGLPPRKPSYACSYSQMNGEHCNQLLTVKDDSVRARETPDWQAICLLRRQFFADPTIDEAL